MTVIVPDFQPAAAHPLDPRSHLGQAPWVWHRQHTAQQNWESWAKGAHEWLTEQDINPRDAMVILPVGAVLPLARQAWNRAVGGWQPAIETVASLMSAHAWRRSSVKGAASISGDAIADRIQVGHQLGKEAWARQWASRDPRGFEHAMDQVVQAAHDWVKRAQAIPPRLREPYWQEARSLLAAASGGTLQYGAREKLLLAWALEWVIESFDKGWPSDALFELTPRAWIGVSAGGSISPGTEAHLMLNLLTHAQAQGVPCRWDVARCGSDDFATPRAPAQLGCADAEDEARHTAALVLKQVQASREADGEPVALIALDRSLIRRVRAMLDGAGATVADETGWRLSTARAAAVITRMLVAASPQASTDDLLDWIKSGWLNLEEQDACDALEAWCRRHGWLRAWDDPRQHHAGASCPEQAIALWQRVLELTAPYRQMRAGKRRVLADWIEVTRGMLHASGAWPKLLSDEAGALVAQCLHLADEDQSESVWSPLLGQTKVDGVGFVRWVHDVLESTTFRPSPPAGRVDVVITPMARAVLRPFQAIVIPGADAKQLGSAGRDTSWLGGTLRRQMLLATPDDLRQAQWEAFELLLTRPSVICLYRAGQGSEPLEPSPWLQRWSQSSGRNWQEASPHWQTHTLTAAPVTKPSPRLSEDTRCLLPLQLSATSYEALRQCPYRFFAQSVLRLQDVEELEEGLDRSDYGTWLHEVIHQFHLEREQMLAMRTEAEDVEAWLRMAERVLKQMGLHGEATRPYFLPYRSVLSSMAQGYVKWLHQHEKAGWRCVDNESEVRLPVPLPGEVTSVMLKGKIDRTDACYRDEQRARMVIDYKSGSLQGLKDKVKRPLEDTQLPFYAALVGSDVTDAAYLHLDAKGATLIPHPEVQASAQALLEGLQQDMSRLMQGAAMPALGDTTACSYCAARGLCRRDHWPLDDSATTDLLQELSA